MRAIGMHKRENTFMYNDYRYQVRVWEFPIGPVDPWDEAIADDRKLFPPVHIHWSEESRDCDGGHGDYGIHWPTDNDRDENGEVNVSDFWRNEIQYMVYAGTFDGTLKITGDPYNQYERRAEWSEGTEEGFRHREVYLCVDDCEDPTNTVYDQYAQMAGY